MARPAAKLVPLAYGIKKLQIGCVVEDDKVCAVQCRDTSSRSGHSSHVSSPGRPAPLPLQVGTDFLEEEITKFEDLVQSVDVAAFNKV